MKVVLLVTVAVVFLLISPSRADDGAPARSLIPGQTTDWVGRLQERLKGRMLGILVHKGMPMEEVAQLADNPELIHVFGLPISGTWGYCKYGLWISFSSDNVGAQRVDKVTFSPLFE
jgi:hypothetical protein